MTHEKGVVFVRLRYRNRRSIDNWLQLDASLVPFLTDEARLPMHRPLSSTHLKLSFRKWVAIFGVLGLIAPAFFLFHFLIFRTGLGNAGSWYWPSSAIFLALDTPDPSVLTIVLVYVFAVVGNVLFYMVLGSLAWSLLFLLRRLKNRTESTK